MKNLFLLIFFLSGLTAIYLTSCSKKSGDSTPDASLIVTVNNATDTLTEVKVKIDTFRNNDYGYWLEAQDQSNSVNLFLLTGSSIAPGIYNAVPPYGSDMNIGNMGYVDFPPTENSTVTISYINNGLMTGSFSGNFNGNSNVYGFFKNVPIH